MSKTMWDSVVGPVAEADWDVVVPDLRGFGESAYGGDEGSDEEPSLALMARDVLGILDRVGVASAVIVGLSLGGYVAMELLRQDPTRVAGLVLADTKASADSPEAAANRLSVANSVLAADSTEALARAMLVTLVGKTSHDRRPEVVAQVRRWILSADPHGVAWAQRAMAVRPDSHADLAAYRGPALVLWGAEDEMSPRTEQDSMMASLRDARLEIVPEAGHLSAVESPDFVARALVSFLEVVRRLPSST